MRARPFNHVGPGQADDFVVSALARRMVEAELAKTGTVRVGNLAASRDFTDVRDVVRAYRLLATSGVAGEAYNICSGRADQHRRAGQRDAGAALLRGRARARTRALFRPVDVPVLLGDASKLESSDRLAA